MQHFTVDCKQASNNDVPRRTGTHKVVSSLAGENDVGADHKAGDQKDNKCHVSVLPELSVLLAHSQL